MSPASVLIERLGSDEELRFEDERFLFVATFFFGANLPGL
jgi:hypothetical protein